MFRIDNDVRVFFIVLNWKNIYQKGLGKYLSGGNQMTNEELIEKVTEWLLENTREYEFEYWGGSLEEGVKFYDFKTKEDMIDDLKTFLNSH